MVSRLKAWWTSWRESRRTSQQLVSILQAPALPPSRTADLYIVQVDFPVSKEMRLAFEENFANLREKYGIDFFLLEPGIKLSRFDDI